QLDGARGGASPGGPLADDPRRAADVTPMWVRAMANESPGTGREVFGSRFTFVAAGIGMAVGTGNLWRFPRVVGEWGGGAFLIAIVIANLVWAIPLLMAE